MALCAAVPNAFRDAPGFVPDDILPQIPAVRPQRKGQHPGNPDQVFAPVAVPDVDPQRPVRAENALHFPKHVRQFCDILLR